MFPASPWSIPPFLFSFHFFPDLDHWLSEDICFQSDIANFRQICFLAISFSCTISLLSRFLIKIHTMIQLFSSRTGKIYATFGDLPIIQWQKKCPYLVPSSSDMWGDVTDLHLWVQMTGFSSISQYKRSVLGGSMWMIDVNTTIVCLWSTCISDLQTCYLALWKGTSPHLPNFLGSLHRESRWFERIQKTTQHNGIFSEHQCSSRVVQSLFFRWYVEFPTRTIWDLLFSWKVLV